MWATTTGPDGSSRPGRASGPAASAAAASFGDRPLAVGRDPDRGDAVPRRIRGAQHVGGRRARHVVFGRLPAEDHDEMDPVVGHRGGGPIVVHRPNGTVRPREDSGIGCGRRRGWAPDRTRRRIRRGIVRLALDPAGRAVRADRGRARRPRLHRSARCGRGGGATSRAGPSTPAMAAPRSRWPTRRPR